MLNQIFVIADWALIILAFGLGSLSLYLNPKDWNNRLWFLMSMAITIWAAGHLVAINTQNLPVARLGISLVYFGATPIPIFFYNFVVFFVLRYTQFRLNMAKLGYACAAAILLLIASTNLIINDIIVVEPFGAHEKYGPLFILFPVYFFGYVGAGVRLLYQTYKDSDGFRQHQMYWLLVASVIAFIGGATNFLYIYFPTPIAYPWGQLIVWTYPILVTYGIFAPTIKIGSKF